MINNESLKSKELLSVCETRTLYHLSCRGCYKAELCKKFKKQISHGYSPYEYNNRKSKESINER